MAKRFRVSKKGNFDIEADTLNHILKTFGHFDFMPPSEKPRKNKKKPNEDDLFGVV